MISNLISCIKSSETIFFWIWTSYQNSEFFLHQWFISCFKNEILNWVSRFVKDHDNQAFIFSEHVFKFSLTVENYVFSSFEVKLVIFVSESIQFIVRLKLERNTDFSIAEIHKNIIFCCKIRWVDENIIFQISYCISSAVNVKWMTFFYHFLFWHSWNNLLMNVIMRIYCDECSKII